MKPKRGDEKIHGQSDMAEANMFCLHSVALPIIFVVSAAISYFIASQILGLRSWGMEGLALIPVIFIAPVISGITGLLISLYFAKKRFIFFQRILFALLIVSSCNSIFFFLLTIVVR